MGTCFKEESTHLKTSGGVFQIIHIAQVDFTDQNFKQEENGPSE